MAFCARLAFKLLHEQLDNLDQVGIGQRLEEDDFVEAVEELGVEGLLHFLLDQLFDLVADEVFAVALEAEALLLHQVARADVRGHDEDDVLEVDGVAEAVGQLAVFKNLQQDVEDIRMRLLDFVEQDDRVRRALDAFGQLAALLVAHVSRRRADELGDASASP